MNLSIFYEHPIQILSFFSLIMALCSVWVKKNFWIWGSFGFISLGLAFASGLFSSIAILPLAFFTLLLWGLQFNVQGFSRFLLAATAFLIGGALFFHLMPGFFDRATFPYPLCLNYGKAFVGLILLGWIIPTLSVKDLKTIALFALIATALLTVVFVFLLPKTLHFHFSLSFFPWALVSLFFVVIPEEALLRGFLQKELVTWIGGNFKAQVYAALITTLIYPLFHLTWVSDLSLLIPTFVAGLTYAILYQATKLVETSILCHFLVGCIHFLFFGNLPFFKDLPCLSFGL